MPSDPFIFGPDQPQAYQPADPFVFGPGSPVLPESVTSYEDPSKYNIKQLIMRAADKYKVPRAVLLSMAEQESSLDPTAVGPKTRWGKAKGLFQYIDRTARDMNIDAFDPVQAAEAAAKQLADRIKEKGLAWAIAAHHAGDNPKQHGKVTAKYTREILARAQKYEAGDTGREVEGPGVMGSPGTVDPFTFVPTQPRSATGKKSDAVLPTLAPSFGNVKGNVAGTAVLPERSGLVSRINEAVPFLGAIDRWAGDVQNLAMSTQRAGLAGKTLASITAEKQGTGIGRDFVKSITGIDLAQIPSPLNPMESIYETISPEYKKAKLENRAKVVAAAQAEAEAVLKAEQPVIQGLEARLGRNSVGAVGGRAVGGLLSQPEQAYPIIAGIASGGNPAITAAATIPLANSVYDASVHELTQLGATKEEAIDYARKITAIETGLEFGAAKVGGGIAGAVSKKAIKDAFIKKIASRGLRIGQATGLDVVGEVGTNEADRAVRAHTTLSSPEAQSKLNQRVAEDTANQLTNNLDAAAGALLVRGPTTTPAVMLSHSAAIGKQTADATKAAKDLSLGRILAQDQLLMTKETGTLVREETPTQNVAPQAESPAVVQEAPAVTREDEAAAEYRSVVSGEEVTPEQVAQERQQEETTAAPVAEPTGSAPVTPVEPVAGTATPVTATKPDRQVNDADVRELARAAGIDVKEPDPTLNVAGGKPANPKNEPFVPRLERAIKKLVGRNTSQTADIQNLIHQKKVVFAPNPESIGRSEEGAASFDPTTGEMYIYLDRTDPDNVVEVVAHTLHEATHAGQFNDRDGRPNILRQMMGQDKYNEVQNLIRGADGKNTLATKALAAAKAASPDTAIQDLEVVPYFVSEATKARQGFGRLGGVVRDIKAGARGFLRDKLGADLDITLDEIDAATQRVAGEIAQTNVAPTEGQSLQIIGGQGGAGFAAAQQAGDTYTGAVDQKERYEIFDVNAELTTDTETWDSLLAGKKVPLGEVIGHDALFTDYPDLAKMPISVNQAEGLDFFGVFTGREIELNKKHVQDALKSGNVEELRNTVLHEAQHAVQGKEGFIEGTNKTNFIPRELREAKALAEERVQRIIKSFELGIAENSLPPAGRAAWAQMVRQEAPPTHDAKVQLFLEKGMADDSRMPAVQRMTARYRQAKDHLEAVRVPYDEAASEAHKLYMRDYGEAEARNTELRSRMLPAAARATRPESTMKDAAGNVAVEDTLDTKPFAGGRNLPAQSLNVQPTQEIAPEESLGERETIRRIKDHGTRVQTADIKIAEDLDTKFRDALSKDLNGQTDLTVADADITAALTAVENADPVKKKELWAAFKSKYPNLSPVLVSMRNAVDKSSRDIVRTILNSGRTLSPKEVKDVQTILANQGKYLTRAYAAFQRQYGRPWAEDRWADYKNKLSTYLNSPGRLSEKAKENVETVLNGIAYIQKKLIIPDNATLADLNTDSLLDMYGYHFNTSNVDRLAYDREATDELAARREAMIAELAKRRDALSPQEYKVMAERVAKELLGLDERTSPYSKLYSDLARDPGTLKTRQFVPEEIRRMLGEITNPGARVLSTLMSNAALLSRATVLSDILTRQNGKLVIPASRINEPGMAERFPKALRGAQYGPLDGFFATTRTADAITDTVDAFYTYEEAIRQAADKPLILLGKLAKDIPKRTLAPLTRMEKIFGVVLKPYNWAGNLAGSWLAMTKSGNFSPSSAVTGVRTAKDYIIGTAWNTTTDLLDDALRYINLEAAEVAEMQKIAGSKIKDYMTGKLTQEEVRAFIENKTSLSEKRRRVGRTGLAGYAMLDAWAKVANFKQRVELLQQYYEALGDNRNIDEIKREAGDVTSFTNISNERVPKILKVGEERGLTKFISYFSEVMRTTYTNYAQAFQDLARAGKTKNPESAAIMRSAATKRFLGNTVASLMIPAQFPIASSMVLAALGAAGQGFALTPDDENSKRLRRMLSEFNRYQDILPFGFDEEGHPIFLPISQRLDPHGPFTDIARILVNGEDDQETFDALKDYMVRLVITPTWLKAAIKSATQDTVPESKLANVFPEATDAARDFFDNIGVGANKLNKAMYTLDSIIPGLAVVGNPAYHVKIGKDMPEENRLAIKALEGTGATFETFDPNKALKGYGIESSDAKRENRAVLADDLLLPTKMSDTKFMQQMERFRINELERWVEGYKNVESLRAWGYDEDEIHAMLVGNKWSKAEATKLINEDDTSILSLDSLRKSKQAGKDSERLDAILALIEENADTLEAIGIEVSE